MIYCDEKESGQMRIRKTSKKKKKNGIKRKTAVTSERQNSCECVRDLGIMLTSHPPFSLQFCVKTFPPHILVVVHGFLTVFACIHPNSISNCL